jgi:hypothetical protein
MFSVETRGLSWIHRPFGLSRFAEALLGNIANITVTIILQSWPDSSVMPYSHALVDVLSRLSASFFFVAAPPGRVVDIWVTFHYGLTQSTKLALLRIINALWILDYTLPISINISFFWVRLTV